MLALEGKLESLVTIEEELIDELEDDEEDEIKELDSAVEEDEDDSGINDDIDGDDVDSLMIKLVLGMDVDMDDDGKGISHPVKINAKKGMANPMNRKVFSLCIQSILSFMIQKERCFLIRCKIATSLTILRY